MHDTMITPAELRHLLADNADVHVLDVRTGAEFESAHIPGSYHVPLDSLSEHREELRRHLNWPVILVCQSGGRAAQAGRQLADVGMSNVRILDGGIGAWLSTGGHVNQGRPRWGIERQVRLVAGLLVLTSAVTGFVVPPAGIVAAAVGAGLTFSSVTNTCGMAAVLARLPYNRGATCDIRTLIAELTGPDPTSTPTAPAAKAS